MALFWTAEQRRRAARLWRRLSALNPTSRIARNPHRDVEHRRNLQIWAEENETNIDRNVAGPVETGRSVRILVRENP